MYILFSNQIFVVSPGERKILSWKWFQCKDLMLKILSLILKENDVFKMPLTIAFLNWSRCQPLTKIKGNKKIKSERWWRRMMKKKMKDCVLITMCISVTDAWNYDIKNDFHCSKLMLLNEKKSTHEKNEWAHWG